MMRKIVVLIAIMISAVDNPNCLLVYSAITSNPSITPPPRMTNPIPNPTKTPPNAATKKLSFVISGISRTFNAMPSNINASNA